MSAPGEARLHVRVEGRVQGVGYRRFVEREALARGLRGWTRNLRDGSVEVLACGPPAGVDELRRRLVDGPPHAAVARLAVLSEHADEPYPTSFRVLPDAEPGDPPAG